MLEVSRFRSEGFKAVLGFSVDLHQSHGHVVRHSIVCQMVILALPIVSELN